MIFEEQPVVRRALNKAENKGSASTARRLTRD